MNATAPPVLIAGEPLKMAKAESSAIVVTVRPSLLKTPKPPESVVAWNAATPASFTEGAGPNDAKGPEESAMRTKLPGSGAAAAVGTAVETEIDVRASAVTRTSTTPGIRETRAAPAAGRRTR